MDCRKYDRFEAGNISRLVELDDGMSVLGKSGLRNRKMPGERVR